MKPLRILFLLLLCLSIPAQPQQNDVANKLIGAWRLIAVEGISPVRHIPYDHPTGLIMYDRSGWMSVQIAIKGDRKPFAKGLGSGTQEEKADSLRQLLLLLRPLHDRSESPNHHSPSQGLFLSNQYRNQQRPLV